MVVTEDAILEGYNMLECLVLEVSLYGRRFQCPIYLGGSRLRTVAIPLDQNGSIIVVALKNEESENGI